MSRALLKFWRWLRGRCTICGEPQLIKIVYHNGRKSVMYGCGHTRAREGLKNEIYRATKSNARPIELPPEPKRGLRLAGSRNG